MEVKALAGWTIQLLKILFALPGNKKEPMYLMDSFSGASLILSNFLGSVHHEAQSVCLDNIRLAAYLSKGKEK